MYLQQNSSTTKTHVETVASLVQFRLLAQQCGDLDRLAFKRDVRKL